jgi:hypothetical protein
MLKKPIKYKDFDEQDVEEEFYFNISEAEVIELEHEHKGGMSGWLEELVKIEDNRQMFAELKKIILLSYGEKSPDGKQFLKKDSEGRPLSAQFEQSAAYNALMFEIFSDEGNAAAFLTGVFPERVRKEMAEASAKRAAVGSGATADAPTPPLPPTPPTPPTT